MWGFFPNGVTYTLCVITKEKNCIICINVEMWTYSGGIQRE